jgi:membrane-associated HD superfamily phosphohydrolase
MKSTCKEAQVLLDRFLSEDLPANELNQLQAHLDSCAQCQRVLEDEPWERLLMNLPRQTCPNRVVHEVISSIRKDSHKRESWLIRWHWKQMILASAAVAVTIAILINRPGSYQQKTAKREYSEEEIEQAREVMKWTMVYTAQKMKQSENKAIDQVFSDCLPQSVQKSIRKVLPILQGD